MRICPEIDDHEWVSDEEGNVFCQACGLHLENASEAHSMADIEDYYDEDEIGGKNEI